MIKKLFTGLKSDRLTKEIEQTNKDIDKAIKDLVYLAALTKFNTDGKTKH